MNEIIEKYKIEKNYLSSIDIKEFEYLDLGKVLATQIWKTLNQPTKTILKKIISVLLCDKYTLNVIKKKNDKGRYLLCASAGKLRGDNELIIKNGSSFIEPCSHIVLKKENKINIHRIFKKILISSAFFSRFNGINNVVHRIYLAANMTIVYQLSKELDDELKNVKFLLTFMDTDIFENYITQTIQNNGGIVAALQHGQRFYINEPCDSFVGMENMSANYKLVWSKFSKGQYLKAGYPEESLPVVGSTKYLQTPNKESYRTNTLGIFLDGPFSYGSKEANKSLLNIVIRISEMMDFKCIIKPHPVDKMDYYDDLSKYRNVTIVEPDQSIESISNKIDFGIVHTSGVAIDLLILDVPVFIYKTEATFPIELTKKYYFETKEEFYKILDKVKKTSGMFDDFENIRKIYIEPNPYQLHKNFFSTVGEQI